MNFATNHARRIADELEAGAAVIAVRNDDTFDALCAELKERGFGFDWHRGGGGYLVSITRESA